MANLSLKGHCQSTTTCRGYVPSTTIAVERWSEAIGSREPNSTARVTVDCYITIKLRGLSIEGNLLLNVFEWIIGNQARTQFVALKKASCILCKIILWVWIRRIDPAYIDLGWCGVLPHLVIDCSRLRRCRLHPGRISIQCQHWYRSGKNYCDTYAIGPDRFLGFPYSRPCPDCIWDTHIQSRSKDEPASFWHVMDIKSNLRFDLVRLPNHMEYTYTATWWE